MDWVTAMIRLKLLAFLVLLMAAAPAGAQAASQSVQTENATASLISDAEVIAPGEQFWLGLYLQPREGWHTYWRNPGDSGLPTTLEWTLPPGFEVGDIHWPAPHAVPYGPLMNFGYDDDHLLMVPVSVPEDLAVGETVTIKVGFKSRADWLICQDLRQ